MECDEHQQETKVPDEGDEDADVDLHEALGAEEAIEEREAAMAAIAAMETAVGQGRSSGGPDMCTPTTALLQHALCQSRGTRLATQASRRPSPAASYST